MRKGFSANSKIRKKAKSFNPNQDYLDQAVKDYLKEGGKITKIIEVEDEDLERFMALNDSNTVGDINLMKR